MCSVSGNYSKAHRHDVSVLLEPPFHYVSMREQLRRYKSLAVVRRQPAQQANLRKYPARMSPKRAGLLRMLHRLQRTQEIQQILLLPIGEPVELRDHCVRLAAVAGVRLNRIQEAAIRRCRAPVVHEVVALPHSPQRRGAKFIGPAAPCEILSARPLPMLCTSRSE